MEAEGAEEASEADTLLCQDGPMGSGKLTSWCACTAGGTSDT